MADECWVHRGEEEESGSMETPGRSLPLPLLSESCKEKEITGHRRSNHQLRVQPEVRRSSHNAPCFHRTHQHLPHQQESRCFDAIVFPLRSVCVVVVALQGEENIHNPHIAGSPAITNKRRVTALTPDEAQNGHS